MGSIAEEKMHKNKRVTPETGVTLEIGPSADC